MASRRDQGRAAVYRTEDIVIKLLKDGGTVDLFGSTFPLPEAGFRRFGRVEDAERYLDALWQMSWVQEYQISKPALRVRRGDRKAHYERRSHTIAVPAADWALNEMVVLHEVAHALTPGDGHGQRFRRVLADLTSRAIDPVVGILLNYYFDLEME